MSCRPGHGGCGVQAGLQVPRKRPGARRQQPAPADGTDGRRQVWAYDFVFDACANGQQIKCLTVIDEFTRECLAIDVAGSIRSAVSSRCCAADQRARRTNATCARTTARSSSPGRCCSGCGQREHRNGADRSRASRGRTGPRELQRQVPRRVPEHGVVPPRLEAKVVIEHWRQHYNEIRPHSSLGNQTPAAFKQSLCSTTQPEAVFQE